MYCCLCASIIIIVIILISTLSEFGKYIDENFDGDGNEIFTTQHLRDMYMEGIVDDRYNKIRNYVIESAANGKTSADFTIMCIRSPDSNGVRKNYYGDDNSYSCDNYDGYQRWWIRQIKRTGGEVIPKNNIRSEQIKTRVIQKIQGAFPDSNITNSYKNCCDQYNITW
jgi:hypothetical protein